MATLCTAVVTMDDDSLVRTLETDWAQFRSWPLGEVRSGGSLHAAWNYSVKTFAKLRQRLNALPEDVACVAVSGSLARMEAHDLSDLDLIVVIDDRQQTVNDDCSAAAHANVWDLIDGAVESDEDQLPFLRPKPGGIFSCCASWKNMTDVRRRGVVDEDLTVFGHRMQLLIDAQPLAGFACFAQLQDDLLAWYSEDKATAVFEEGTPLHWLRHDVLRYWYSLCSRSSWLYPQEDARFMEVNLKLRSTRRLLISAFLSAIRRQQQNESGRSCSGKQLLASLRETPLERACFNLSVADQAELETTYETIYEFIARSIPASLQLPREMLEALAKLRSLLPVHETR
ncbi:MAG: nucleotidyltransferase domain-containing protein [Planctomycetaceae bacterium]|nr:nucleotidyltransferase domain-containing protein [Planctomycetaceae bacterium]